VVAHTRTYVHAGRCPRAAAVSTRPSETSCRTSSGLSSQTQSRAFSDDATSIVILRPAPSLQAGRRISPAAFWRARDAVRPACRRQGSAFH
jgi:hypothetical protein